MKAGRAHTLHGGFTRRLLEQTAMTRLLALLAVALLLGTTAAAQETPARLRVFPDCDNCFEDYLRNEIRWVDFVRQPQDADVQILSTTRETGGGGTEVDAALHRSGSIRRD